MNSEFPEIEASAYLESKVSARRVTTRAPHELGGSTIIPVRKGYAIYALCVLVLVNIFVLMDRQILTVLAEDIKADLGMSDADIGFIYGTSISVFYAIFSIPLGRLADVSVRKNLIAFCVTAWSLMIMLTGTARNIVSFAVFRAGVGAGEAGAAPPAFSMIADYFSPRFRSTAMSIFASGVPLGQGLGLFVGGWILDTWNAAYPVPELAPLGLRGWQAAFFCIAIPGPFLALWLYRLKEPVRGQSEGLAVPAHPHPFREVWAEMCSVLPFFSLLAMLKLGGTLRTLKTNFLFGLLTAVVVSLLIALTGSTAQWIALGIGAYCVTCWAQTLALRDRVTFAMLFHCRSLLFTNFGVAGYVFVVAGVMAWIVPFMLRVHQVSAAEAGAVVGVLTAVGGFLGNVGGGILSDFLERYTPRARLYVLLGSLMLTLPSVILLLYATEKLQAYICIGLFYVTSSAWYGIGPAVANSLVMPRMRGVSSAFYLIVLTLLGVALGPYTMGYVSDIYIAGGAATGDALRQGILWGLSVTVVTTILLLIAACNLEQDEKSRLQRARNYGEPV